MGDPRRFEAFARFLRTTFPAAATVADVAGGHGELAFWLGELGLRPTIVDPRPTTFPRWIHRTLRKRAARHGRRAGIERVVARVEDADLRPFDLVVALHPDAATEPAVRAAVAQGIDFAVVPCCVFPLDGVRRSRAAWLAHLTSLAPGAGVSALPIDGANIVLWRRARQPAAPARRPAVGGVPAGELAAAPATPCRAGPALQPGPAPPCARRPLGAPSGVRS